MVSASPFPKRPDGRRRPAHPLTDDKCLRRHLVGIDANLAFAAGVNGRVVGLGAPTHVKDPAFDPQLPGSWLGDLSHVDLSRVKVGKEWVELDSSLLPRPFTPTAPSTNPEPHSPPDERHGGAPRVPGTGRRAADAGLGIFWVSLFAPTQLACQWTPKGLRGQP